MINGLGLATPKQNGRHERMHLTLKKEATKPAAANFLQQQARFDKFADIFNNERLHEALSRKASIRIYTGLPDIDYPFHRQNHRGHQLRAHLPGAQKINFSTVFAG